MHPILDAWQHLALTSAPEPVLPDGCRDVILAIAPDGRPDLTLSALQHRAEAVRLAPGTRLAGFRLRPGVDVDLAGLRAELRRTDPSALPALIAGAARLDPRLDEAIGALAAAPSVAAAAAALGVGARGLERLFARAGQPAPGFWLRLARARRAGVAVLRDPAPLAALAQDAGYADQAHMTRDFTRWFGFAPGALRRDTGLGPLLDVPALAT